MGVFDKPSMVVEPSPMLSMFDRNRAKMSSFEAMMNYLEGLTKLMNTVRVAEDKKSIRTRIDRVLDAIETGLEIEAKVD